MVKLVEMDVALAMDAKLATDVKVEMADVAVCFDLA